MASLLSCLESVLSDLDTPIISYLEGILAESPVSTQAELSQVLGEYLLTYDAATEETLSKVVAKIFEKLKSAGFATKKVNEEEERLLAGNMAIKDKFQVGRQILAMYSDGGWYDAEIKEIKPDHLFVVAFVKYKYEEAVVSLSQMKLLTKSVRIADLTGADFKNAQHFTDFILSGFQADWRPDLGVEAKNSEMFYVKTDKQLRKDAALERKALAREAQQEALRKEKILEKKRLVILKYLASLGKLGGKNVEINSFNLTPPDGGMELISNASLRLYCGRRYGLIGRNGVGKTSLLSAMANYEIPGFPTHLRVMHVEQEVIGTESTVMETVLQADAERDMLVKEEAELQIAVEKDANKQAEDRLAEVINRLEEIDAHSAESRASTVLSGLGFTPKMYNSKTKSLSGGWRMRVALAAALFVQPDILLLDEPTNHLDFPSVLWLEDYLMTYPKTLVVVSHDRNFVNNVITDVLHLHNQALTYYRGDYETFEKVKLEQQKNLKKAFEAQEKQRAHIQTFIDRFRYNANRAALVQSRIKSLERMELLEDQVDDPKFTFTFPDCEQLQKPIALVNALTFGYSKENVLLENIDLRVDINSRIGLVGGNGVGKSTLIKLIMGQLNPFDGWVEVFAGARITCFSQHHVDQLKLTLNAVDFMSELFPSIPPQELRKHLGRYGITGDLSLQKMMTLSGGQKSRVAFAIVTFTKPHLIILDEPSNHLDLETVDALIMAINKYSGGILMVSHDQHLLQSCIDDYWAISEKKIKFFDSFEKAKRFALHK